MQLISPERSILVIGSLNANPADRVISRNDIRSMQLINDKQEIVPVPFFNSWGELGMSSMCWHPDTPYVLYIASSTELFKFYQIGRASCRERV